MTGQMIENNTEQYKVAQGIRERFKDTFEILINSEKEEYFIGTLFPDILFLDKSTRTPLFIIEIKKNGMVSQCMNAWKSAPSIPATLYIIVPKAELESAKSIGFITGVKSKFGYYTLTPNGDVNDIVFE